MSFRRRWYKRATGVGTRDESQAGGFFTYKVGEDDRVPDAHPDEDGATENLADSATNR